MKKINLIVLLFFLLPLNWLSGQSLKAEKMAALHFMIGEWVGTSTIYENGKISKQVPAFEKISYDLNNSIIVIELNSELLQLHTIIHFNEKDSTYYYYAFSENGGGKLPAKIVNERFVVQASETKRYIFERAGINGFREYGEKLINGQWVKYFEDVFTNTQ